METPKNKSENIDVQKYIEENIEKKLNQLFEVLPKKFDDIKTPKMIYEYTISELYTNTIQTIIDILNDLTALYADRKYINNQVFRERLFNIFLKDERKIYIGIVLVIFSFILYFIDGSDV